MVEILMATYNGERFIRDQICSIINQTYTNWHLLIHDDGSTDNTLKILRCLSENDERICIIEDGIKFGNAGDNFMHLIGFAKANYIMFADQDDVWDSRKIEIMRSSITKEDDTLPVVIYSSAMDWDGARDLYKIWNKPTNLNNTLFNNCGIQGASSMFNFSMVRLMKKWSGHISMHDHLLLLLGVTCGKAVYCADVLMKYRKHQGAVTITSRTNNIFKNIINGRKDYVIDTEHFKTIKQFSNIYWDYFDKNTRKSITDFISMPKKTIIQRIIIILRNNFCIRNSRFTLISKLILRRFCVAELKIL